MLGISHFPQGIRERKACTAERIHSFSLDPLPAGEIFSLHEFDVLVSEYSFHHLHFRQSSMKGWGKEWIGRIGWEQLFGKYGFGWVGKDELGRIGWEQMVGSDFLGRMDWEELDGKGMKM